MTLKYEYLMPGITQRIETAKRDLTQLHARLCRMEHDSEKDIHLFCEYGEEIFSCRIALACVLDELKGIK